MAWRGRGRCRARAFALGGTRFAVKLAAKRAS